MIKTPEEFVKLRTSSDPLEYNRSANEEADLDVWLGVIKNHPDMKEWVAHNKTIPEDIIRILSKDEDARVRHNIASKRKTPADVLMELAKDSDETIRMVVARNKKTPIEVLKTLLEDEWENIVDFVKKRLE